MTKISWKIIRKGFRNVWIKLIEESNHRMKIYFFAVCLFFLTHGCRPGSEPLYAKDLVGDWYTEDLPNSNFRFLNEHSVIILSQSDLFKQSKFRLDTIDQSCILWIATENKDETDTFFYKILSENLMQMEVSFLRTHFVIRKFGKIEDLITEMPQPFIIRYRRKRMVWILNSTIN